MFVLQFAQSFTKQSCGSFFPFFFATGKKHIHFSCKVVNFRNKIIFDPLLLGAKLIFLLSYLDTRALDDKLAKNNAQKNY